MPLRLLVAALLLAAATANAAECGQPLVINAGIPRMPAAEGQRHPLVEWTSQALREATRDGCPITINFAFGTDYEVLDWMSSGAVDVAILPDLSSWLLTQRDGMKLVELARLEKRPSAICRQRTGNGWQPCAAREYDHFVRELALPPDGSHSVHRALFSSHLSSTGFLGPASYAARFSLADPESFWKRFFAQSRFAIGCDGVDACFEQLYRAEVASDELRKLLDKNAKPIANAMTVVYFPGEELHEAMALEPIGKRFVRERLVMTETMAQSFTTTTFTVPIDDPLLGAMKNTAAWKPIVDPQPVFGVRTFTFTVDETLALLKRQQRGSANAQHLSLVLPGGGVKAAYQSRLIDALYGRYGFRNRYAGADERHMTVDSVIGTSGGSLLGFFVSQLNGAAYDGSFSLFDLLWRPGGRTLAASDVFAFTDMPRYFAIAVTFLIFCGLIAFATGQHTSKFYSRGSPKQGAWRLRLAVVPVLFVIAPLAVRASMGGSNIEHVPVVEGLFYTLMALLVMFADQCVVYQQNDRPTPPTKEHAELLAGTGALMVLVPLASSAAFFAKNVMFSVAFFTLTALFTGLPILLLYLAGSAGIVRVAKYTLVSVVAVLLLCGTQVATWIEGDLQIVAFLVLMFVAIGAYRYSRGTKRHAWMTPLMMFATVLATAYLCWPAGLGSDAAIAYFTAPALDLTYGAFFVSIGFILLVLGATVWAYGGLRYGVEPEEVDRFLHALGISLAHALLTIGAVILIARTGLAHELEMTPSFWGALILSATLIAALFLRAARRSSGWFHDAIGYLAEEHPNGSLIPRRHVRMVAVAAVAVFWWNLAIAPAVYGNRTARGYIDRTIARFNCRMLGRGENCGASARFETTARFITPANRLQRDGTYYFEFFPASAPSTMKRESVGGAKWHSYAGTDDRYRLVSEVIFASGSPFPIFAAHQIDVPGDGKHWFVDGGYSNNVPVDPARRIAATQALVVHSSSPLDPPPSDAGLAPRLFGQLVLNAGRIPGFLFERSQESDRASRQQLFVAALAPPAEEIPEWPNLAQFDTRTVEDLGARAARHLQQRIGLVESWGQPRFAVSEEAGAPATPAGRL